ncbi:MAG: DUF3800 domain-containing protein [Desulfovibrio sp.]
MYLLYLDDAGSPQNKNENYFVLGGICIHEHKLYWINKHLDELAKKYFPEDPGGLEFHASETFSGRKAPWRTLPKEDRRTAIKEVLDVANKVDQNTTIFSCAIHKASFPDRDHVEMAFEELCSRFNLYLRRIWQQQNERNRGIIIIDRSSQETSLQALANQFRNLGTRWGVIEDICEVPLFVDSKATRGIQLADHIAYSVYRRYEHGDINYFNVIEGRFDMEDGKIHGLVHRQTHTPACTCPACMSRR